MTRIEFEVPNETADMYSGFADEEKAKVVAEIAAVIDKTSADARAARLKRMVDGINNDPSCQQMNPEILLGLLANYD